MIKFQIRRKTAKVWQHFIVNGNDFIFSKCYCKTNGNKFRVVEDGGTAKNEYNYDEIEVYDDLNSGGAETFTSSLELMKRLSALQYVGFNKDGDVVILSDNTKQDKVVVVSSSITASNDQKYHVVANATFTDPSPVEGKGYEVFVRNGVATIGGVDYPVGSYVIRTYHSGSWGSQLIGWVKNIVTNNSVSGSFNLDANLADTYVLTLTGNTTLSLLNFSAIVSQQMTIYITGNFALTYPVGAKVFGTYSTTKTNQLVLEKVGSATYITINNYV